MASLLYVRTGSGGSDPDFLVKDLGKRVLTGATWTLISASDPESALGSDGEFSSRQIRDSDDLFSAIRAGDLEWSKDGVSAESAISYRADYMLLEDFTDDDAAFNNLAASGLTTLDSLILNGITVEDHFDGGANKHDASEIDVEGTYGSISGSSPTDLETVLSELNTVIGALDAGNAYTTIAGDSGTATATSATDTINIVGSNGITTTAAEGSPDSLTLNGIALALLAGARTRNVISGVFDFRTGDILLPTETSGQDPLADGSAAVEGAAAVIDGRIVIYDGTRAKWLGSPRVYEAGKSGNARDVYLRGADSVAHSTTGIKVPRDGTITEATISSDRNGTFDLILEKNDGGATIATLLSVTTGVTATSITLDVDVDANDELQLRVVAASNALRAQDVLATITIQDRF